MNVQLERILATNEGGSCHRCQGETQVTIDAIGRTRHRCPHCDGVARHVPVHPDEILKPQTLVPLNSITSTLPLVLPGQLRCQVCAKGVEKNTHRFCKGCTYTLLCRSAKSRTGVPSSQLNRPEYTPRLCRGCRREFSPSLEHRWYCAGCAALPQYHKDRNGNRRPARPLVSFGTRPCLGCGADTPRTVGRPRKDCAACRPTVSPTLPPAA